MGKYGKSDQTLFSIFFLGANNFSDKPSVFWEYSISGEEIFFIPWNLARWMRDSCRFLVDLSNMRFTFPLPVGRGELTYKALIPPDHSHTTPQQARFSQSLHVLGSHIIPHRYGQVWLKINVQNWWCGGAGRTGHDHILALRECGRRRKKSAGWVILSWYGPWVKTSTDSCDDPNRWHKKTK